MSPSAGGCDFPADPTLDAQMAGVVWMPALCTATVALSALPSSFSPRSPAALPLVSSPRQASDGLYGELGTAALPIWLTAGSDPEAPLSALIPFDKHLPYRLASVLRLWQSLQGRSMTAADMTSQRRRRLLLALRALDGRDAGASYRQLAQGLFGVARVPAGVAWKSHDLRSRTMRLVGEAARLRDGGYRGLLHLGPRIKLAR